MGQVRELGKNKRRTAILDAARRIMNDDGISMRALSEEAGVSLVTPYNLFGSKDLLLMKLAEAYLEIFRHRVAMLDCPDGIDKLFAALDLARSIYEEEPLFNRGMVRAASISNDATLAGIVNGFRTRLWQELLDKCVAQRLLIDGLDTAAIARHLIYLFNGPLQRWVRDEIDVPMMHREVDYGFTLCLLGICVPPVLPRLRRHFAEVSGKPAPSDTRSGSQRAL